ncbi:MAG: SDR family oxidoreductase [Cyclobacteriaceae bacterium]|nr:SDR family oxidoreductase [Cyclobacteriaceae bacterium]MCH8516653.1 SDR family oxidoreductase [Cyclobacteriaceae bacterium]
MMKQRKVALITGATSGIGKAFAFELGNQGYCLGVSGRNQSRLDSLSKELKAVNIDHLCLLADSANKSDNEQMVSQLVDRYGQLDLLVNNAGISMRALFEVLDLDTFEQVMDINFYGAVYATKYALPHLKKSKGGIIAVSSINGHRGTPARTAYTASKYAMNGFFEALRTEVMHEGIKILVVSPGFTGTNIRQNALNEKGEAQGESPRDESKMMSAEEVAKRSVLAFNKGKRDLVLTTQGKLAVFLNKWMPSRMDKIVYDVMKKEPNSPLQ